MRFQSVSQGCNVTLFCTFGSNLQNGLCTENYKYKILYLCCLSRFFSFIVYLYVVFLQIDVVFHQTFSVLYRLSVFLDICLSVFISVSSFVHCFVPMDSFTLFGVEWGKKLGWKGYVRIRNLVRQKKKHIVPNNINVLGQTICQKNLCPNYILVKYSIVRSLDICHD